MVIKMPEKDPLIESARGNKRNVRVLLQALVIIVTLAAASYYFSCSTWFRDADASFFQIMPYTGGYASEQERLAQLGLTPHPPVVLRDRETGKERKLHGRFLHITDIHPDSHYIEGSSIDEQCHRNDPDGKGGRAPRFGKACSGCDGPVDLMDYTLKWIEENIRDDIDFVIWTGDNVRHDNDRLIPRTEFEIFEMNEVLAQKMHSLFANHQSDNPRDFDAIVVPSLGNNDVFPHNMFAMGPTLQTREYYKIWSTFVPQEQQRIFDRSASFVTEVIPGKLAVISINTLFLFKSNPLVDNCDSKKQPGYQLLVWFGNVLQEMRERGIKVWLSGHVPPIPKNYAESCYDKFTLWTYEYRDIIIGSVYGHMNMDHFIPADGKKSWKAIKEKQQQDAFTLDQDFDNHEDDSILEHAMCASETHLLGAKPVQKESYMNSVRDSFYKKIRDKFEDQEIHEAKKKKKSLEKLCERYSIVNIAGSVIPTFNPGFRIWEYNISGIDNDEQLLKSKSWESFYENLENIMDNYVVPDGDHRIESDGTFVKNSKSDKSIPKKKPKNLPLGPAHVSQLFSPTKYVQYYADLKQINKDYKALIKDGKNTSEAADIAFKYQIEYSSRDEPYSLESLLVKDFISLASQLASDKKIWKKFMKRAFMSSGYKD